METGDESRYEHIEFEVLMDNGMQMSNVTLSNWLISDTRYRKYKCPFRVVTL